MKGKSILYILLLLVFLYATLGVVSASENISNSAIESGSAFEILGVEEEIIFEDEVLSASADVNEELNDGEVLSSSDNLNNGSDGEVLSLSEELNNELASSITYNNEDDFLGLWETVYTTDRGCDFVPLSNGYTGFCAKREMTFPTSGTPYITEQQYILTHDNTGGRVDNKLRLAIIYYADNPEFQKANAITIPRVAFGSFSLLQHLIWYLSKYDTNSYSMGDLDKYPALKNAYYDIINRHENGEWIPEERITYTYDDYQVTYEFLAFRSSSTYQTLIGYKKTITENPISYEIQKVTKTPEVMLNDQVQFELLYKNTGKRSIDNVYIVEDKWDDGLVYDSFIDENNIWTHSINNQGKHVWTLKGNLPGYSSQSLYVVFNTTKVGTFTNYITSGDKTAKNNTTVRNPGIDVNKVSLTPSVLVGEQTLFLISVWNTGDVDLTNVFVEESFPDGLIYDSFTGDNWRNEGNVFYYDGVLGVGDTASFTIAFNTTVNGTFVNCVVAGSDKTDNKTANNTTKVLSPGLDVNKVSLTPSVLVGEQTLFLISVWNTGDVDLTNVFVEESFPDGLIYDSFTGDNWRNEGNVFYYDGVLGVGETASFTIAFNTTVNGTFVNCVVAGSDKTDNKTANNTTKVLNSGLEVSKITITPVVNLGEQVTFEIVVRNTGETVLTKVFVEESSYDGLIYDSFVDNGLWTHSIVNGKNVWTLNGDLALNEVVGFFVNFNTTKEGNFTNVIVGGTKETENKTTNNTTTVLTPDISVQKITLTPIVHVGNQTSFEIIVKNTGKVVLTNVFLEETSYDGLTYDSFVDNGLWTHSIVNGKNVWTLNKNLNINEIALLTVKFNTTVVGNFTNIVTVGSSETEKKIANNTTTVYNNTVPVQEEEPIKNPDIDIEKIALEDVVILGTQVRFEIVVKNTGNVILNNVIVSEKSFEGLVYDSFIDYSGSWTKNDDLTWSLNTPLYVSEMATFYVVFNTTFTGEFTNIVSVDSNETESKDANDSVVVVKPDFAVEKVAINKSVMIGEQVMFEIVVHNIGQVTLNDVVVREDSFEGLVYDSFVDYTGLWTKNGDLSWKFNNPLYVGEYAGFFVVFNTTSAGEFMNVIVANSREVPNKTDNDTVEVLTPDISVQKITLTPLVHVGNKTSFEIVVKNTGKVVLTNVFLEETSYDDLTYDSFIDNGIWTYSVVNGKNVWTLNGNLNINEIVVLTVRFNTTIVGNFTNIVTVGSSETENKIANNTTIVYNTTVPEKEEEPTKNQDIDIEKIALNDVVILGSQVRFEIIVRNTGNVILNNVVVSEDSFEGLTYDSFIDYTGLWTKNADLTWKLNGPLYTGEIAAFYVVFNTTAVGEFTNVVSVDSDETEKKNANDSVEVIKPDFAVEKIAINKSVLIGDPVMFEIVVHNFGQVTLNDVVVREESFEGLVYDSFIDYTGLWTKNADLTWSLNTPLYVGEYAGFFVVFNTTSSGEFMNVIVADSREIPNKTANDTVEVLTPGLNIQKITINRTVNVGEQVLFEIIVQNTGKVVLNNVVVSEDSFDGLTYYSFIDYNKLWTKNNDLSWTLNTPLYAGEYLSFYVVFDTTRAGNFTNIVSVSSDKTGKVSANNVTEVIEKQVPKEEPKEEPIPVSPETPKTPEPPVTPEVVLEKNETAPSELPEQPKKESNVLPATGNPLIMVLLALIALGGAALRRKNRH